MKQSKVGQRGLKRITTGIVGRDHPEATLRLIQDSDDFLYRDDHRRSLRMRVAPR